MRKKELFPKFPRFVPRTLLAVAIILNFNWAGVGQLLFAAENENGWKEIHSRHFFIYYKDAPIDFVQNVNEAAENYYEEITHNLGFSRYEPWSYEERAKIYIYSDQQDYITSGQQAGWSHGVANAREKMIRTFPSAHGFFDSTLPHELGHIIFREFIGFRAVIPLWIDEGVAMYQEKARRWGANQIVAKTIENKTFLSLRELSETALRHDTDRGLIDLYYAEAASAVYFLITEYGQYRFVSFCQELKDGEPFEEALRRSYSRFDSLEDLNRAWVDYLKKSVSTSK